MDNNFPAKKDNSTVRWLILFIMCFITFSNYYTWEVFSPFKEVLGSKYRFSNTEYGFLQAAFSLPSSILFATVIGGILMDRIGSAKIGIYLILLVLVSGIISVFGVSPYFKEGNIIYDYFNSFMVKYPPHLKILTLSSFIFGIAAVNLFTLTAKSVAFWFMDHEYGLASSLNVSAIRIGTGGALVFGPYVFTNWGWPYPIYTILIFQIIVVVLFVVYLYSLKKIKKGQINAEFYKGESIATFKMIFALRKNVNFYMLMITGALFYPILYTLLRFGPDIMQNIYHLELQRASLYSSIIPLSATVATPITGYIIDRTKEAPAFIIVGSFLLIIGLTFIMLGIGSFLIPLVMLGISFGILPAAYWFIFGKMLGKQVFGSASGLMLWLQQTALWITPVVMGYILDSTNPAITSKDVVEGEDYFNYFFPMLYLLFYSIVNLIICSVLAFRYHLKTIGNIDNDDITLFTGEQ
ncbi:MAG: nitrate/nitrite transporter [Bacteroidales bacterium]